MTDRIYLRNIKIPCRDIYKCKPGPCDNWGHFPLCSMLGSVPEINRCYVIIFPRFKEVPVEYSPGTYYPDNLTPYYPFCGCRVFHLFTYGHLVSGTYKLGKVRVN